MSVAFPFVDVEIDTSGLAATARRAPGVLAIVGVSNKGTAQVNVPTIVGSLSEAAAAFAGSSGGSLQRTPLYNAMEAVFSQNPGPSKVYGVKATASGIEAALGSLAAADDVTVMALASNGAGAVSGSATASATNPNIKLLFDAVKAAESDGDKRLAVVAIDSAMTAAGSDTYHDTAEKAVAEFRHPRMVVVAARGAKQGEEAAEVAAAAAAAIAGQPPAASMVLKRITGFTIPLEKQFSPTEIKGLAGKTIIPLIDPALIVGPSLHFGDGYTFSDDNTRQYIDVVRLLDDVEFKLRAGLINMIGDARITKSGLISVVSRAEGILSRQLGPGGIDAFKVQVPVLDILRIAQESWSPAQKDAVNEARSEREVQMFVTITLGPAVHLLKIQLAPNFA